MSPSTIGRSSSTRPAPPGWPKAADRQPSPADDWSHWFAGMMDTGPRRPDVQLPAALSQRRRRRRDRRGAGQRRFGGDPRKILRAAASGTTSTRWDCTLVPVYRRAVPLSGQRAAASARAPPSDPAVLRQRAAAGCVGRRSRRASASRRSWSSTPPPKATCRCTTSTASPARSAAFPPILAHRFPAALVKVDIEQWRAAARRTGILRALRAERGRARRSARSVSGLVGWRAGALKAIPVSRRQRRRSCATSSTQRDAWFRTGDLMRRDEQRLLLFRRPYRRHLPLEGRERIDLRSRRGDRDVSRGQRGHCLRRCNSGHRRPRRHGRGRRLTAKLRSGGVSRSIWPNGFRPMPGRCSCV